MKKPTLDLLHRYRQHLLERQQIVVQEKLAEENAQKARVLQLRARLRETHEAKLHATTPEEFCELDGAASYLHGRLTLAGRALTLCGTAREEAVGNTLRLKRERDQVGHLIENNVVLAARLEAEAERAQLNDLATSRHALNGAAR